MYIGIGNEFNCRLTIRFVTFGLLRFILFAADGNDRKNSKYHFLTLQIFRFEFSVWRWLTGD